MMKLRTTCAAAVSMTALLGSSALAAPDGPMLADFDRYAQHAMADWGVPGMAVVVVKDGKVVFIKGYGVRKVGAPEKVDPDTVFAIASATKSFTSAAVGILVSEGKLNWDDRVRSYLPGLELYDSSVAGQLTVRDLLSQKTCLRPNNILTWNTPFSRSDVIRRMRYIQPECPFRSRFVYDNLNFMLAGEVVAQASGESWNQFVEDRIFRPLGMKSSTTRTRVAAAMPDLATPHIKISGRLRPLPLYDEGATEAAGSIHTTARDLAQWLKVQLGDGATDGMRLWSKPVSDELHAPQTVVGMDPEYSLIFPEVGFLSYGLGWFTFDFDGRKVVEHDGESDGMEVSVAMLPDQHLGVAILTNTSMIGLSQSLVRRLIDDDLGAPAQDWSAKFRKTLAPINDTIDLSAALKTIPQIPDAPASLPLAAYRGRFASDLLGDATVVAHGDELSLNLLGRTGRLRHWHYNTFAVDWGDDIYLTLSEPFVSFDLDARGKVATLKLSGGETFQAPAPAGD